MSIPSLIFVLLYIQYPTYVHRYLGSPLVGEITYLAANLSSHIFKAAFPRISAGIFPLSNLTKEISHGLKVFPPILDKVELEKPLTSAKEIAGSIKHITKNFETKLTILYNFPYLTYR